VHRRSFDETEIFLGPNLDEEEGPLQVVVTFRHRVPNLARRFLPREKRFSVK
jgi:hypothetical protein